MITSKTALDFAFHLFLSLNDSEMNKAEIKRLVQKWYVLSVLTQRYSSAAESQMDRDLKSIKEKGFEKFFLEIEAADLSDIFWEIGLIQNLETTSINNPAYNTYIAAQIFFNDTSFLSNSSSVRDLVLTAGDVHHIFPKDYLKKNGFNTRGQYNQIANFTYLDTQVNINIGEKAPNIYLNNAFTQCDTGVITTGNIMIREELEKNILMNSIPLATKDYTFNEYQKFLAERRKMMAKKIKEYYKKI